MKKKINFKLLVIVLLFLVSCDGGFPTEVKKNLPAGHTKVFGIAYHKIGFKYPYEYDSTLGEPNCAGAKCHHSDLKGGIAVSDSINLVSPSCYQCHGKIWIEIDTAFKKIKNNKLKNIN